MEGSRDPVGKLRTTLQEKYFFKREATNLKQGHFNLVNEVDRLESKVESLEATSDENAEEFTSLIDRITMALEEIDFTFLQGGEALEEITNLNREATLLENELRRAVDELEDMATAASNAYQQIADIRADQDQTEKDCLGVVTAYETVIAEMHSRALAQGCDLGEVPSSLFD